MSKTVLDMPGAKRGRTQAYGSISKELIIFAVRVIMVLANTAIFLFFAVITRSVIRDPAMSANTSVLLLLGLILVFYLGNICALLKSKLGKYFYFAWAAFNVLAVWNGLWQLSLTWPRAWVTVLLALCVAVHVVTGGLIYQKGKINLSQPDE